MNKIWLPGAVCIRLCESPQVSRPEANDALAFDEDPFALMTLGEQPADFSSVEVPIPPVFITASILGQFCPVDRRPLGPHQTSVVLRRPDAGGWDAQEMFLLA